MTDLTTPRPWPLRKVVSGGQTGADEAGLRAAKALGYETGGWLPKGCRTENGPRTELLTIYNMQESVQIGYERRTYLNVRDSTGTIIIGGAWTPGSILTKNYCQTYQKPWLHIPSAGVAEDRAGAVRVIRRWIEEHDIEVLNVAGNRESKNPGIGARVEALLLEALKR